MALEGFRTWDIEHEILIMTYARVHLQCTIEHSLLVWINILDLHGLPLAGSLKRLARANGRSPRRNLSVSQSSFNKTRGDLCCLLFLELIQTLVNSTRYSY